MTTMVTMVTMMMVKLGNKRSPADAVAPDGLRRQPPSRGGSVSTQRTSRPAFVGRSGVLSGRCAGKTACARCAARGHRIEGS
jgi:hypothetical protein